MASWLDDLLDRGQEAKQLQHTLVASLPREVRSVWVQTRSPTGPGDCGAAEEGFYFVENGEVVMCDGPDGKPNGVSERVGAQGNPRAIASRLRRRAWEKESGASDFGRPLNYSPLGIA